MSKFVLEINTDNAAFEDKRPEVVRILENATRKVWVFDQGVLLDLNGNTVGSFQFLDDEAESPALAKIIDAAMEVTALDPEISAEMLANAVLSVVDRETLGEAMFDLIVPVLRGR